AHLRRRTHRRAPLLRAPRLHRLARRLQVQRALTPCTPARRGLPHETGARNRRLTLQTPFRRQTTRRLSSRHRAFTAPARTGNSHAVASRSTPTLAHPAPNSERTLP